MATQNFIVGKKYRLITRAGVQKQDRVQILRFLGRNDFTGELYFDARPVSGTQILRSHNIISAAMVSDAAKVTTDSMAPSRDH